MLKRWFSYGGQFNAYLRMDGKYMIALATKCVRMCEANARHPAQTIQMFDLTETNRLTSQVLILGLINANTR